MSGVEGAGTECSDEELLAQAQGLDEGLQQRDLFDQLFRRYYSRVAMWCLRMTGNRESAADLAQEVLTKAYRGLSAFRAEAKFSTWLYSITRNHCLNELQRQRARGENMEEPLEEDTPAEDRFDLRLEREQELRLMRELLQKSLDATEQAVMTLHYGEEMTLEVITRLLGLKNDSGAKAYIVSARRKLKTAVARWQAKTVRREAE
jgi:RNA polymerase sigma-70 factor (ECF subfamily)